MKDKKFLTGGIIVTVILAFIIWQTLLSNKIKNMSCGGDFSSDIKCPLGTTCTNNSENPLEGGLCKTYINGFLN